MCWDTTSTEGRAVADHFDGLEQRISTRAATVAVIGQGYVGLMVASAAAVAGMRVRAIDVRAERKLLHT